MDKSTANSAVVTPGINPANNVFQLQGVDAAGKIVFPRAVKRKDLPKVLSRLATCLIGMKACATAHVWAEPA